VQRDNVEAGIVQDFVEAEPAENLAIGKVGLPKFVDGRCFMLELICRFQHDERRAGDQVMCLECVIDCGFRYKAPILVYERHRQLEGRQPCLLQGKVDYFALQLVGNAVPNVRWFGRSISQAHFATLQVSVVPAVKRCAGNAELGQCPTR